MNIFRGGKRFLLLPIEPPTTLRKHWKWQLRQLLQHIIDVIAYNILLILLRIF